MHNVSELSGNGCICLGNAQLAEGTNAACIKTVAAIDYAIDGVLYSKAATDNIAVSTTASQADGTTCMYVVTINAAGTVAMRKGTEQVTGSGMPMTWPSIPSTDAVIGAVKVKTSGAAYVGGTTDLGAGTVTDTYYNFMQLPAIQYLA